MRDEFDTTRVEEGIAARVSLRMLLPDMDGAVSAGNTRTSANTRAVDADVENRLDSLRVLVFNSNGEIVTNRKYTAQSDGSLSSLQIDTWSGNNLTFCFVANSRSGGLSPANGGYGRCAVFTTGNGFSGKRRWRCIQRFDAAGRR